VFTTHCFIEEGALAPVSKAPPSAPRLPSAVALKVIAQGAVDLPPWTTGDNTAVLSLLVGPCGVVGSCGTSSSVSPSVEAYVHFAHGPGACNTQEFSPFAYDFVATGTETATLTLKGPGAGVRDRANLPAGASRAFSPCAGIDLGLVH